jgi:hypothetical protein
MVNRGIMANKEKRFALIERQREREQYFAQTFAQKEKNTLLDKMNWNDVRQGDIHPVLPTISLIVEFLKKKRSKLVNYTPFTGEIKRLSNFRNNFIRQIDDLVLRGKSPTSHFNQLVRHLLVKYPLPSFWDNVWDERQPEEWCNWYIKVAQGQSVKDTAPIPLTKKQAHALMKIPSEYHPREAIRIVQFREMGGDMLSANALLGCEQIVNGTLRYEKEREEFYQELMRWFASQKMLDPRRYKEICDWAVAKKFNPGTEGYQPNMTMKGRPVDTVMRDVQGWHDRLNKMKGFKQGDFEWEGYGYTDWLYEQKYKNSSVIWSISQIRNSAELRREGQMMGHCVYSYADSCRDGHTSIWSLKKDDEKLISLEIRERTIIQARGKYNRGPTDSEMLILKRFAGEKIFVLGRYLED